MKLIDNNIRIFVLHNSQGVEAEITNLGGRVVSLFVPDKNGVPRDVVLGFDSPNQHWSESNAFLRPGETYKSHTKFHFIIS